MGVGGVGGGGHGVGGPGREGVEAGAPIRRVMHVHQHSVLVVELRGVRGVA